MIDQDTIQKVLDRTEIVEVVREFVNLKKRGVNYLGNCPFHDEKTPSFTVSPAKGIYKCFGCQAGGNAVNFIMEHEQLSYPEAIKWLARKYHIEVQEKELTPEQLQQKNERESMLVISSYAKTYFNNSLLKTDEGKAIGLSYFYERGFNEHIIKKFELGYCPEKNDSLTDAAIRNGYQKEYLIKTGLTVEKSGYRFDRFRGRVIFPIHSLSGNVIAFGGRILKKNEKTAKYLNSPESELYHKSKIVYGIFHAKSAISKKDKCFMVEGYTDVLSLHQCGIENVVASSGTALTSDQIRLIRRFSKNLTILYDGDAAGIKASLRGIDLALEESMNVKIVLLPEGEDPDSFAKDNGAEKMNLYIEKQEQDFIEFKSKLLLKESSGDPVKKANVITNIVTSIAKIPDSITRSVYIKHCATILQAEEKVLYSEVGKIRQNKDGKTYTPYNKDRYTKTKQSFTNKPMPESKKGTRIDFLEQEIIRVLLSYGPKRFTYIKNEEEVSVSVVEFIVSQLENELEYLDFSNNIYKTIFHEILSRFHDDLPCGERYFTMHTDTKIAAEIARMISTDVTLSKIWQKGDNITPPEEIILEEGVPWLIMNYKDQKIVSMLKSIEEQLKQPLEDDNIQELMKQYVILKQLNMEISKQLGDRTII